MVFIVVYSDYSCQQRDKLYEKMFFSKLMQQPFSIFLSFFIIMNVDLEIFIKTHVLLYFYNETKSSHQRCSIKKLFLKISNFTRKHLCWSLCRPEETPNRHLPVNIAKYLRTPLLKNICK